MSLASKGAGLSSFCRALLIATLAMNAIIGPIFFKLALDRTNESKLSLPALPVQEEVVA